MNFSKTSDISNTSVISKNHDNHPFFHFEVIPNFDSMQFSLLICFF